MPTVSGRSRPWTDHRLAVEGMAWKYRTGAWTSASLAQGRGGLAPAPTGCSQTRAKRYKGRNVVERCFNRLKQWRGIAMRSDKLLRSYRAAVSLAATPSGSNQT